MLNKKTFSYYFYCHDYFYCLETSRSIKDLRQSNGVSYV